MVRYEDINVDTLKSIIKVDNPHPSSWQDDFRYYLTDNNELITIIYMDNVYQEIKKELSIEEYKKIHRNRIITDLLK